MKTYLVTGGAGFIGSRIVRDLIREGAGVMVYDLYPEGSALEWLLREEEKKRLKVVQGDVTDLPHLMHIVKENNIETVFHIAAVLSTASSANPMLALAGNCEGTLNIFETARLLGLKKVVWASSMSVFGPADRYAPEYIPNDAPHYPWGVYGACKSFNENLAAHYVAQYGLDITAVRYNFVYGAQPGKGTTSAIIRELIENPALGKPGKVPFGGLVRGWQYVDDAARATVMASKVTRPKTGTFSTMGDIHSIIEVAEYVRSLIPGADITLLPGELGLGWKFDTVPVEEEIGYRPGWTMERGVRETINTVRGRAGLGPV